MPKKTKNGKGKVSSLLSADGDMSIIEAHVEEVTASLLVPLAPLVSANEPQELSKKIVSDDPQTCPPLILEEKGAVEEAEEVVVDDIASYDDDNFHSISEISA